MVIKFGHFGKKIRNTLKVLKCGPEKDGQDEFDRSGEK
jgi:hypothetical protein